MASRTFEFWHDLNDGREVLVTYSMTRPVAATHWQPAEGGEVEILSVEHGDRKLGALLHDDDAIYEAACERSSRDWSEEDAAEADWRYQERRDRLLMAQWEQSHD